MSLLLEQLEFQRSFAGGVAVPDWSQLPLSGSGQHFVDEPAWTAMRAALTNYGAPVNVGGNRMTNIEGAYLQRLLDARTGNPLFVFATGYHFAAQTPGGTLTAATPATITLSPVPAGVNGSDIGHRLYISGGVGTAEAVLITGGNAIGGTGTGTITFTPANSHSGSWSIQSATAGIQEAVCAAPATGWRVMVPTGTYALNGDVSYGGKTGIMIEMETGVAFTGTGALPDFDGSNAVGYLRWTSLGRVEMTHGLTSATSWMVWLPNGSVLNTTGSTTQGCQEALDYARLHAVPFCGWGGGITPPGGSPASTALSQIRCTTTLTISTGWVNDCRFVGVNILYDVLGGADPTQPMIKFNTTDMENFDGGGQWIYTGTGDAVLIAPTTNNGEAFIGNISSRIRFGSIVLADPVTQLPKTTSGTGLRISTTNGPCSLTTFEVQEINGGQYGVVINNPGLNGTVSTAGTAVTWVSGDHFTAPASMNSVPIYINGVSYAFTYVSPTSGTLGSSAGTQTGVTYNSAIYNVDGNAFDLRGVHQQSVCSLQVGTSATLGIWGNRYSGTLQPTGAGTALSTWGGNDFNAAFQWAGEKYDVSILGGLVGIQFNASAANNLVVAAAISAGTDIVNSANSQTNRVITTRPLKAKTISVGASPFTYQNNECTDLSVTVASGTVSLVETKVDGGSFFTIATATNYTTQLKVGQYLKVTYASAPSMTAIL